MGKGIRIRVQDVALSYDGVEALSGVSFDVKKGDFLGIIGPNGSGKSTLLRCIASVLEPDRGAVLIDDNDVKEMGRREIARSVGVVPQSAPIDFAFTVRDVVLMGRTPHLDRFSSESKEDVAIAERAMRGTVVSSLSERAFDELSGGERQRVVIARALTQDPKILLLDEPTQHLDISAQYQILDLVRRLNRENQITVIAVFHDLNLASQYSDSLLLMTKGKVGGIGAVEKVLTPENVRESYGIDALIERHPVTGRLQVVPYSKGECSPERAMPGKRVHVICGGGSGARAIRVLHERGFRVSAGVLNAQDTDHDCALALGIPLVSEAPFSPISERAHAENLGMIASSDLVLVTDFPVGPGNIRNIEAADGALAAGAKVVMLVPERRERDFTGGKANEILARLMQRASVASNLDYVLDILS
jgi:iron complex transport system ATP-binding protein